MQFGLPVLGVASLPPPRRSIVLVDLPDDSVAGLDLGLQAEGAALGVRLQLGRLDLDRQLLVEADAPVLDDLVLDVDEADGAEGEAAIRHYRHVQREGEHVRVGGGQVVAQGEAADAVVGGDLARRSARTRGRVSSSSGISLPPPGTKGSSEAPGIIGAAARA